ncbi:MAG TPA: hypothetical protein VGH63_07340 [Polyangia bacterium]|jgi:hypothetical protein
MRTIVWLGVVVGAMTSAGCATQSRARGAMLGYTDKDHLFVIEHHDPEHGGRIVGTVCAVDVQLDARLRSDGVLLTGAATDRHASTESSHFDNDTGSLVPSPSSSELPYRVEVRDRAGSGARDLFGMIGDEETLVGYNLHVSSPHAIDLHLTRDAITGQLGGRQFDLHARGDDYVGTLTMNGLSMPYIMRGRSDLWRMPAAAQASILPLLMTCSEYSKMIQLVDLRQTTQPESEPPPWVQLPHAAPRPLPQMAQPMAPMSAPPPAAIGPAATPQQARVIAFGGR